MEANNVHKVKLGAGRIEFKWDLINGDEFEVKFTEPARPELDQAMASLVAPAVKLLELPAAYGDGKRATGLSISFKDDGNRGAVVTMQKVLQGSPAPLILNTPHLPQEPYSEEGACLPGDLIKAIDQVVDEAKRYIRGERQQMRLPLGDGGTGLGAKGPGAPSEGTSSILAAEDREDRCPACNAQDPGTPCRICGVSPAGDRRLDGDDVRVTLQMPGRPPVETTPRAMREAAAAIGKTRRKPRLEVVTP